MAAPLVDCLGRETVKRGKNRKSQLLRTWSSSITASVALHFSSALGNSPFLSGDNLGGTVSQECCPLLADGLVQDSRRAGQVFFTWTLNGLIRAKELTHNNCNTPKLGLFLPVASELLGLPLLKIFRLSFNSVCYSIIPIILLFQLTIFSFYCSQPRNQRDTKPLSHGPLSHPVFQLFQSHEMIWDNDKCVPGVWWQVVIKYLFYNNIKQIQIHTHI